MANTRTVSRLSFDAAVGVLGIVATYKDDPTLNYRIAKMLDETYRTNLLRNQHRLFEELVGSKLERVEIAPEQCGWGGPNGRGEHA